MPGILIVVVVIELLNDYFKAGKNIAAQTHLNISRRYSLIFLRNFWRVEILLILCDKNDSVDFLSR